MKPNRFPGTYLAYPLAAILAVACSSNRQSADKAAAKAVIAGYQPNTMAGSLLFINQGPEGIRIQGEIIGLLPDREYAMHIHENGDCSSPQASGGHFDPFDSGVHGVPGNSPGERHAGDLPNIKTDGAGRAEVDVTSHLIGTGASEFSVLGKSVVVHSGKDDYRTQPAGASGEKIACGIIQPTSG